MEHGVNTRALARKFVAEDWKQAEILGMGRSDFILFDVTDVDVFANREFPQQYEGNISEFREPVEITPVTYFDDLEPFELIETQDWEMMRYVDYDAPPGSHYLPIEEAREFRSTAEEEYFVSTKRGDELETPEPLAMPAACRKPCVTDPVA
jgi:hypothetical protein